MKILLVSKRALEKAVHQITKTLDEFGVTCRVCQNPTSEDFEWSELVIVLGGDGDVLQTFHQMGAKSIPVLGLSESDGGSFLTEIGVSDFREVFPRVVKGDYQVEEAIRLGVQIDGRDSYPALNEVAIFPSRSAAMMEYRLQVDGETIWRDLGDGVVVATPTGSTAYAMSAGGPMVHLHAPVYVVVPVNSLDITRRPLIVSDTSCINLGEISSRYDCEAVIDGTHRVKVRDKIEVYKTTQPAKLVRLPQISPTADKMTKKVRLAEELLRMPPSTKLILKTLEYEGPLTQRDLVIKTLLPGRTARLALTLLIEKGLVKSRPLLRDARQRIYHVVQ